MTVARPASILIASWLAVVAAGNVPWPRVQIALHAIALAQPWDVFAPDPNRADLALQATIELVDGRREIWTPPRASAPFALLSYHWDLWTIAAASGHRPVAERIARRLAATRGRDVARVTLTRRWAEVPPPGSAIEKRWHESDFLVFEVPR